MNTPHVGVLHLVVCVCAICLPSAALTALFFFTKKNCAYTFSLCLFLIRPDSTLVVHNLWTAVIHSQTVETNDRFGAKFFFLIPAKHPVAHHDLVFTAGANQGARLVSVHRHCPNLFIQLEVVALGTGHNDGAIGWDVVDGLDHTEKTISKSTKPGNGWPVAKQITASKNQ